MKRPTSADASGSVDLQRRSSLARLTALWAAASVPLVSCGGGDDAPAPNIPPGTPAPPPGGGSGGGGNTPPPPPPGPPPTGAPRLTLLYADLYDPWGFAFLPDRRILVTERTRGRMFILSADGRSVSAGPLSGLPASPVLATGGQGGLLDVVLDPDYGPGNEWVYYSYSEQLSGARGTAVNRARLVGDQLIGSMEPIFRAHPKGTEENHYGSRLAFKADKTLFITIGDKTRGTPAQDLTTTLGKVVRINRDGSIPTDNPNLGAGARPGIWSSGHRNPQGAVVHPVTDELWVNEHGPQGGDELNLVRAGSNYGWPNRSYGCPYEAGAGDTGCQIGGGGGVHAPQYSEPATWWPGPGNPVPSPSIAPSGLTYYDGSGFPEWRGNLFLGALAGTALWRIELTGSTVTGRQRLFGSASQRIRQVRQGPDGWIYFITTNGMLYRVDREPT